MSTEPPEGYVSSADACKALGISPRTLTRRVRAGEIAGEYIPRPQGTILYVKLPEGYAAPEAAGDGAAACDAENHNATGGVTRGPDTALAASLLEEVTRQQAALLTATERAVRAEGERDAARQAAKAAHELVAEIRAQRDDLAKRLAASERENASLRARVERPWWRFWG